MATSIPGQASSILLQGARSVRDCLYGRLSPNAVLNAHLKSRLRSAYESGLIRTVFDIGAHKGTWASEVRTLMPAARLILFEANPIHAGELAEKGFEHFIGALSKPGVRKCTFYSPDEFAASTGGSYYKEVTPRFNAVEGKELEATTLADIVTAANLPQPDFIKIDTQGSELDIIAGGEAIFQQAKLVLMELPVIEYNSGAPDISAYLARMSGLGFLPVELTEVHSFGPVIIQLDFLFAPKSSISSEVLANLRL